MNATIIGIQTIVNVANQFFGTELGQALLGFLKGHITLTPEQEAKLDAHFADYQGWKFPQPPQTNS